MRSERKASDEDILKAYHDTRGSTTAIAAQVGLSPRRVRARLADLGVPPLPTKPVAAPPPVVQTMMTKIEEAFAIPRLPEETPPVEELIAHRKKANARAIAAYKARELIRIPVKLPGPIVLAIIGDPHVDDNGCDWVRLDSDLALIDNTPGMFACHAGDITNNFGGRLMHLWSQQSTDAAEAIKLAEYVLTRTEPLVVILGNHDNFPGPLRGVVERVMHARPGVLGDAGVRVQFDFPCGFELRMHARHDFPGRSMYSTTHGMKRELREGYRDHLLIAGHLHCDEVSILPVETDGLVSTLIRVSGYKVADHYASTHRFVSKRMAPTAFVLVDPAARLPAEVCKVYWDGEECADILGYKRRRAGV